MARLSERQMLEIEDYLEGRLSGEDRLRLEKQLEQDPAARDYVLFLRKLKDPALTSPRPVPPPGLVDKTMERLFSPRPKPPVLFPKTRAAWVYAAIMLLALGGGWFYASQNPVGGPSPDLQVQLALDAPGARQVEIAGDFTGWQRQPLRKGDSLWNARFSVKAGRSYQYVFILNGRVMVIDPENEAVVKDKRGDFFSVLQAGVHSQEGKNMKQIVYRKPTGLLLALGAWLTALSPSAAYAQTPPAFFPVLQKAAESAGLDAPATKQLLDQAQQLSQKGVPDQVIEDVARETLGAGKGPTTLKALERCGIWVSEGLAPVEAGKAAIKEAKADGQALDQEMEKTLASGLAQHSTTSQPVVLTQKQMAEKLEQKREEWEDRLENQKRIQAIQNDSLEQHK